MHPLGATRPWLRGAACAAALLLPWAVAASAAALPMTPAQVSALGPLTPWQARWLESGGASGVPTAPGTPGAGPMIPATLVSTWTAQGFEATNTASGSCWTGSVAAPRAGAYRCMAGNAIFDPCFAVSGAAEVACPSGEPARHRGTLLRLTAALPAASTAAPSARHPWFFTLAGGGTCGAMTGTLVAPDHPFGCLIPATATAPQQSVYCTVPTPVGAAYDVGCAAVAARRAPDGAPQLNADAAYTVAQMWL